MEIANLIGSLVTLALVIVAAGSMTKALIVRVWEQGLKGKHVGSDEAYRVMFSVVVKLYSFTLTRKLATVVAVVVFLASIQDASFQASLGFSAIAFAMVGLATSATLRALRAAALCLALLLSKKQASSLMTTP